MNNLIAKPMPKPLTGEITIPPDKSISHRAIILGSLTKGVVKISNFSRGGDCTSTLNIFKNLGLKAENLDEKIILANFTNCFLAPNVPLDCGNSGTSMRLLSGLLSGQNFDSELIGDVSLSKRPMKRVIEPLSLMDAKIESNEGRAPLKIKGAALKGISYESKIASAQVKSSIILAGLNAKGETTVFEPLLSRNHTEKMLGYFEADIDCGRENGKFYTKVSKSSLVPKNIFVPGDISSAAFFMVAAAIIKGSDIIIKDVGLNTTRTGILDLMKKMNAEVEILDLKTVNNEELGDIRVKYSADLKGVVLDKEIIPRLIDEIPIIAVLAAFAEGETVIKDAADLKNKESDRINCTAKELSKLGVDITPTEDGLIIRGNKNLTGGADLNCYHDHRLAMSFYVASLAAKKESLINEFGWVNTSFPEFLELFARLGV